MGALEYEPDHSNVKNSNELLNIKKMSEFASNILNEKQNLAIKAEDDTIFEELLKLGKSAGGARAKAIVAYNKNTKEFRSGQIDLDSNFVHWLIKFDGVTNNGNHNLKDEPEYTLVEYAYYKMAKKAGITMSECLILPDNNQTHFMIKRFDRVNGDKIYMQSLGVILHIDYN